MNTNVETLAAPHAQLLAARRTGVGSNYPYLLIFTRHWTSGHLAGLSGDDSLPMVREADGQAWIDGINAQAAKGNLNYRVTGIAIVPLAVSK